MLKAIKWAKDWPDKHRYVIEWLDKALDHVLYFSVMTVITCAAIAAMMAFIYVVGLLAA